MRGTFNNARDVIRIIKDSLIEYNSALFMGAGFLGLEEACFDLTKYCVGIEWADDCLTYINKKGVIPVKADLTTIDYLPDYDIVTFFDTLEHLTKQQALDLLGVVNAKQIVMFIPVQDKYRGDGLEDVMKKQAAHQENNEQMRQHLSLWTPEEMEELGYKVWYKENYFGPDHNNWGAMIAIKWN